MYAIVDIAGKQFKVSKGDTLRVPQLSGKVGKDVVLDKVLLISDAGKISVGKPVIAGASVKAKLEGDGRERKVLVFKKKRRKGYRVTRGHRQGYTNILIQSISSSTPKSKAKPAGEKQDGA